MAEFVSATDYLGDIKISLATRSEQPGNDEWVFAASAVLKEVSNVLDGVELKRFGTKEFRPTRINELISDRVCHIANPRGDGIGIAQSDARVREELRLNLSELDWFAHQENYGTAEEKRFLVYFSTRVAKLKKQYDSVMLVRNERQVKIFDFDTGEGFEPDFLLFLQRKKSKGFEQVQVFVEPKGGHLVETDRWKESLLLRLEGEAIPVKKYADDNEYLVWGLPFFTHETDEALQQFKSAMAKL